MGISASDMPCFFTGKESMMNILKKYKNSVIELLLIAAGAAVSLGHIRYGVFSFLVCVVSNIFLIMCAISDIRTRTISGLLMNSGIVAVYSLRFCSVCYSCSNTVISLFLARTILVFFILKLLSGILDNKIGDGDFDVAYVIYLSVGPVGLFGAFIIACVAVLITMLPVILIRHKKLNTCSVPFIPYLYIGYLAMVLIVKERVFI